MLKIGLTGGSGSGKGEFSRIFDTYDGCFSLDTDKIARQTTEKGCECLDKLAECFGKEILNDDGTLNRKKLASIAFTDKEKHQKLNQITHFYILKEIEKWICDMQEKGAVAAVIDAPLLFESGCDRLCDITVGVLSPYDVRLYRIMSRDSIDETAARTRLDSRPGDNFFKEKCDFVLENDGSLQEFQKKTKELLEHILTSHIKGTNT